MKKIVSSILFAVTIITIISMASQETIDYYANHLNLWTCNEGFSQSPIDINSKNSIYSNNYNIVYEFYRPFYDISIRFNGQHVEIYDRLTLKTGSKNKLGYIIIDHKGYLMKFYLDKIVLHTESEHFIDGTEQQLEVQLYHTKDLEFTSEVNINQEVPDVNERLVISTFYSTSGQETDSDFMERAVLQYRKSLVNDLTEYPYDISYVGFTKSQKFYFYKGSDTVFPCNENFLRYVNSNVFRIKQEYLNDIRKIYNDRYTKRINTKKLAELNGRPVFRNFFIDKEEARLETERFEQEISALKTVSNLTVLLFIILALII